MIRYSESTLRRKVWLDLACAALLDYRDPSHVITKTERDGLAKYLGTNASPSDAADLYQAATS